MFTQQFVILAFFLKDFHPMDTLMVVLNDQQFAYVTFTGSTSL